MIPLNGDEVSAFFIQIETILLAITLFAGGILSLVVIFSIIKMIRASLSAVNNGIKKSFENQ
jgi:hypothetical protein